MISFKNTERGFGKGVFLDSYNTPCSIQDSSIMGKEPYLWLGVSNAKAQILRSKARHYCLAGSEGNGWMDFPLPDGVEIFSRMHLSKTQVKTLIDTLQKWVEDGALPE